MIQEIKKERFFAFFERLDVRLIHDKTKTRPLSRHWLFGAIPSAVHIKIRNTYTCICVHIQNTGLDKLTRLHLSTFDCPLKLLSLSRGRERGKYDRCTLQVKFAQPTILTTSLTWWFLARPLIKAAMSLHRILFETTFPSVKWITNCSHSNWIEFKENCVLLHTIDIVIQLTYDA